MLKGRHIRRLSAIACFAFSAIAVILWIRSYRGNDHVDVCYAANQSVAPGTQQSTSFRLISANTSQGVVSFHVDPAYLASFDPASVRTGVHYHSAEPRGEWWWKREAKFGFAYRSRTSSRGHLLAIPFWFLTLLTAAAGALLWKDRPYRFTLRGALIATTFVAIVLGVGVSSPFVPRTGRFSDQSNPPSRYALNSSRAALAPNPSPHSLKTAAPPKILRGFPEK